MNLFHLIAYLSFIGSIYCSRILVLYPFGTLSHKMSFYPVIEALGAKGHDVTVITSFAPKETFKNVREIVVPQEINENEFKILFEARKAPKMIAQLVSYFKIAEFTETLFKKLMANKDVQTILHNKEADLVIVDSIFNDFCMPIVEALNLPFIFVSSSNPMPWHLEALGGSVNLAVSPGGFSMYSQDMGFLQRVDNFILHYFLLLSRNFVLVPRLESYTRPFFPNFSSIREVERKASLFLTSTNPSYSWPRSLPSTIVEIGALHCRPSKPLPEDLKRIADGSSEHGFVVFSLGSLISGSAMPKHAFDTMLRVFGRLPQNVIWRWETDMDNVPPNVHLVKWLPQQDLLGHPNARLFISHGGLLGIQEAIYHGVPLLGLPIANDQYGNIIKLVYEGMSVELDWDELTDGILHEAISDLINNNSYKANAERLSRIMRDTPISGVEKAIYWIEYVMRHNGTAHLKSNTSLPWYQYYLLDVYMFLFLCVICTILALILICRNAVRLCTRSKREELKKNQ